MLLSPHTKVLTVKVREFPVTKGKPNTPTYRDTYLFPYLHPRGELVKGWQEAP